MAEILRRAAESGKPLIEWLLEEQNRILQEQVDNLLAEVETLKADKELYNWPDSN